MLKKTVIFVTHDIFEAFRLGNRIAIMDKGKIVQIDTPLNITEKPVNSFVESFMGKHRKMLIDEAIDK